MSHRPRLSAFGHSRPTRVGQTIHCKQVQQHIPIVDAVKRHVKGDANCFACGRAGDACQHEASKLGLTT